MKLTEVSKMLKEQNARLKQNKLRKNYLISTKLSKNTTNLEMRANSSLNDSSAHQNLIKEMSDSIKVYGYPDIQPVANAQQQFVQNNSSVVIRVEQKFIQP